MLYQTSHGHLRRRHIFVVGLALVVLAIVVISYALLAHRSSSTSTLRSDDHPALPAAVAEGSIGAREVRPRLASTSNPEAFARLVAEALFAWNTTTVIGRADHVEQLLKVGDPTGESTAGLLADLGNYLPTPQAWVELAQYQTKQWLVIDSATTPAMWSTAVAQAAGGLLPGTTAVTIHGVRHRSGVWEGAPVTSEHDVAFTLFVVCGPSYPDCHLLRLSILNEPLG